MIIFNNLTLKLHENSNLMNYLSLNPCHLILLIKCSFSNCQLEIIQFGWAEIS